MQAVAIFHHSWAKTDSAFSIMWLPSRLILEVGRTRNKGAVIMCTLSGADMCFGKEVVKSKIFGYHFDYFEVQKTKKKHKIGFRSRNGSGTVRFQWKLVQTAQNDAADLSSMVLRFRILTKNWKIKILRFKKRWKFTKSVFGHETVRERSVSNEN